MRRRASGEGKGDGICLRGTCNESSSGNHGGGSPDSVVPRGRLNTTLYRYCIMILTHT